MAIGKLWCTVLDVNDLADAERFWAEVTGFRLRFSGWNDRFSSLGGDADEEILLQLVPETKTVKNRAHLDFGVEDVLRAAEEVKALGGSVIQPLRSWPEADPGMEWVIAADPFGNEFCLIRIFDRFKISVPTTGHPETSSTVDN
jgi:predicted enzyme related to lactoylglutathione lyase